MFPATLSLTLLSLLDATENLAVTCVHSVFSLRRLLDSAERISVAAVHLIFRPARVALEFVRPSTMMRSTFFAPGGAGASPSIPAARRSRATISRHAAIAGTAPRVPRGEQARDWIRRRSAGCRAGQQCGGRRRAR